MKYIFDTHVHIYPDLIAPKVVDSLAKCYNFTPLGKGTYDEYIMCASQAGLTGFLLFSVATSAHQVDKINISVADNVKRATEAGFRVYGFGSLHPDTTDISGALRKCRDLGLYGIKLHPDLQETDADDPRFLNIYSELERTGMRLYLHVGDNRSPVPHSSPIRVAKIAEAFPNLKIAAAHLGGYREWEHAPCLYGRENVWFDCSGVFAEMAPDRAEELIRACGTDRVMFGSDYPVDLPAEYIDTFNKLNLTEEERENIMYRNMYRFLGL